MCPEPRSSVQPTTWIAKQVYNELVSLNDLGFCNWVTDVYKLASTYSIDIKCEELIWSDLSLCLKINYQISSTTAGNAICHP